MSIHSSLTDRRPAMTLLSGALDVFSHCCRVVLLEKDIECNIEYITARTDPSKIGEFNPYGETPTLLERDVALYDMSVILEYLDERFPHPPLMPVDPIMRAKTRLMVSRLIRDWIRPLGKLGEKTVPPTLPAPLKASMQDGLTALSTTVLVGNKYFSGDDFTLVDAYFGPLLWRLEWFDIELPKQAGSLRQYSERLFSRPTFYDSLSEQERGLR